MLVLASDASDTALIIVPVFIAAIGFAALNLWWTFKRSAAMLERHLRERGYVLVSRQYRWLMRGPFWWRASKGQSVYRFAAEDAEGVRHEGWARVGGFFFGLLSNQVDIRWDAEPRDQGGPGFPVVMPGERLR